MPTTLDAAGGAEGAAGAVTDRAADAAGAAGETETEEQRVTRVNTFIGSKSRGDDAEYFTCEIVDMTGSGYKALR